MKVFGIMLLLVGLGSVAFAAEVTDVAPEISPASIVTDLALVSGAVLVMRGRRKK